MTPQDPARGRILETGPVLLEDDGTGVLLVRQLEVSCDGILTRKPTETDHTEMGFLD